MSKAVEAFWYGYRAMLGFNPDKPMTFEERMYWRKMGRHRQRALEADNPHTAILQAPVYDKQYFLEIWWNELDRSDKEYYLTFVWANKPHGHIYGLDWWLPFFEDVGYITNTDLSHPDGTVFHEAGLEYVINHQDLNPDDIVTVD
jgi:hypothetical protein